MDEEIPGSANVPQIHVKKIHIFIFFWGFLVKILVFLTSFPSQIAHLQSFLRFLEDSRVSFTFIHFKSTSLFWRFLMGNRTFHHCFPLQINNIQYPGVSLKIFPLLSSFPSQGSRFDPSVKTLRPFCTHRRPLQSARVTFRCPSLSWFLCNPCRAADTWKSGGTMVITCRSYERFARRLVRGECRYAGHPNVRGGVGNGV